MGATRSKHTPYFPSNRSGFNRLPSAPAPKALTHAEEPVALQNWIYPFVFFPADQTQDVVDHLKTYFFEHPPESNPNIIRAAGASTIIVAIV
jgi:hypothetical protein